MDHFADLEHFAVILADEQTRGKGRFNRKWISPDEGNLYFSLAMNKTPPEKTRNLTQIAALATAKMLSDWKLKSQIKWPNDVLISGKKVCGILCETILAMGKIRGCALGVGINVNMSRKSLKDIEQPATSMAIELKQEVDRMKVLEEFLQYFSSYHKNLIAWGFSCFRDEWKQLTGLQGKAVRLYLAGQKYQARIVDVNEDGSLKVHFDGKTQNIFSGEIDVL